MGSLSPCNTFLVLLLCLTTTFLVGPSSATTRSLSALVRKQPLLLTYHNGTLLKGKYTVNVVWYGSFSPSQKSIILDFLASLNHHPSRASSPGSPPSVSSWWSTTERYRGGSTTFSLGEQLQFPSPPPNEKAPILRHANLVRLARRPTTGGPRSLTIVLTSAEVAVEGFCPSRCGTHGSLYNGPQGSRSAAGHFIWVGNSASQCPGKCAWPFHQPIYGPQRPPLVAPNGDVGVDGMVINLATLLAGTVTNPYGDGYFQGPKEAPLEAVSACTGMFGKGAYPGYPGRVLVDKTTGASFNARGLRGREYLLPAMWDPVTATCSTLV